MRGGALILLGTGAREQSNRKDEPIHYDADKARGAEIILTKRRNRVIFMGGLVGFVVLALILDWFA